MPPLRTALSKGFSVVVLVALLGVGALALTQGGFGGEGLLSYLLALALALAATAGIWTRRIRLGLAGTLGLLALALRQSGFLFGLAALLALALGLAHSAKSDA